MHLLDMTRNLHAIFLGFIQDNGDVKRLPEERMFQHACAKAGTVDCLAVLIEKLELTTAHLNR